MRSPAQSQQLLLRAIALRNGCWPVYVLCTRLKVLSLPALPERCLKRSCTSLALRSCRPETPLVLSFQS